MHKVTDAQRNVGPWQDSNAAVYRTSQNRVACTVYREIGRCKVLYTELAPLAGSTLAVLFNKLANRVERGSHEVVYDKSAGSFYIYNIVEIL